jgi:16S rRNA (guanine1207-N2)-methyltransferase
MPQHYYSKDPQVESNPRKWNFTLRNINFQFTSDSGVFSKKEVDFGSSLLIESFEDDPTSKGPILDMGCGYGPIGLSIAETHKNRVVHMVDVNERAIELSEKNAQLNNINNVKIYSSDLFVAVNEKEFSAILSNPPIRAGKNVVHEILSGSYEKLCNGGTLWVVIQKKQGAPSAFDKMKEVFGNAEVVEKKKGYQIIKSIKVG